MSELNLDEIENATVIGSQILNDLKHLFCSVSEISNADDKGANKMKTIKKLQDLDPLVCSIPSIPKIKL